MSSTTPAIRPMIENKPGKTADAVERAMNMPLVTLIGYVSLFLIAFGNLVNVCLLYTSPSPRDQRGSRMPSSA